MTFYQMTVEPNASRRIKLLLLLCLLCVLIGWIACMLNGKRRAAGNIPSLREGAEFRSPATASPGENSRSTVQGSRIPARGGTTLDASVQDGIEDGQHPFVWIKPGAGSGSGAAEYPGVSGTIAILDLDKVLAAHADDASESARLERVRVIKKIVSTLAVARHLEFVFDTSSQRQRDSLLLFAEGVPDITEEVLQALTP